MRWTHSKDSNYALDASIGCWHGFTLKGLIPWNLHPTVVMKPLPKLRSANFFAVLLLSPLALSNAQEGKPNSPDKKR